MIMRNRLCQLEVKEPSRWFYGVGRQFLFTFFIIVHGRRTFLLHFLSSPVGDEYFFYIFYRRPWAKNVLFTFFSFARGRRASFLHFTIFARGRQAFFFCFTIFRAVGRVFFFCFPLIRCFRDAVFSCFSPWGSYRTHIG